MSADLKQHSSLGNCVCVCVWGYTVLPLHFRRSGAICTEPLYNLNGGQLLGIPNSLLSFWYLANRQQIMGLVYFDKRAFAYLINPVAPRQTTQFITPALNSVHACLSYLESNANTCLSLCSSGFSLWLSESGDRGGAVPTWNMVPNICMSVPLLPVGLPLLLLLSCVQFSSQADSKYNTSAD